LQQRRHGCGASSCHDDVVPSAANSAACLRRPSALVAQRTSIRTLRPSVQPNWLRASANAAMRACASGSSAVEAMSTPMRRTRSPCCARTASGQAAVAPPSNVMNSRLLTRSPRRHG
jgi:hypothetical protein